MSAAQCVGCLPARIATSTKPGLLRVRCPAHLVDTIGVRNPAAPSSNGARKPRLTLPNRRGARRNLSRRLLLSALRRMRCIWPAPTFSTTDLSLRWLPTLRCILAMPRLNPTMRRALGCALRCLDPTYPDSPLGPSQDANLASQCGSRGSNSKLRSLLPPWESIAADVERQDSHCLAEAQVAIACFLAALWRRRTNNFERDVVSARGPAEERTGVPSLRPRWNTAGGNCQQTCERMYVNVWIDVCVRVCMCLCMCVLRANPSVCSSVCLSFYFPVCLLLSLSSRVSFCVCLSLFVCACLSPSLFVNLSV